MLKVASFRGQQNVLCDKTPLPFVRVPWAIRISWAFHWLQNEILNFKLIPNKNSN